MSYPLEYRLRIGQAVSEAVTERREAIRRLQAVQAERAWRGRTRRVLVEYRSAGSDDEWTILDV